jgi:hypothetical protein
MADKPEKKKLTDEQLVELVNQEFDDALGAPDGDISLERAKAFDYYLRKLFGDEVEGESQLVTSDVSEVIDGTMPTLLKIFTMADNLVSFDPVSEEDVPGAEQESDYVTYLFFKKNPAFLLLFYWFFDALVQKNGIVMAYWDEYEEVEQESYEGLSEDELLSLLEDEDLEPVERSEREAETIDPASQQIVRATVHDITFRRISKTGCVKVDNVPPEEYRISGDSRSLDPSGARMVGREREPTRSELLDMGFDPEIVDSLEAVQTTPTTTEQAARRDKSDEQKDQPVSSIDRSQDKIQLRLAYIKVDADGDGRAERREIYVSGNKLLGNEIVDRQPFHVICPYPLPHKHFGQASAEKSMDIQEVTSTLVRQVHNNLYHTNNPSHAVWEQGIGENTMDDLLTRKVGSVNRFARMPSESYMPLTVPFTAAATFPMLEYWDKTKRDRTGVMAQADALNPDALKHVQTTALAPVIERGMAKIETIARIFAETGVKSLFLHIHELAQKHQQKVQIARLRNKFVPVNPSQWRTRRDMTVNIGLGIGTREQNLLHLNATWEKQMQMVQAGMMNLTVTPQNLFRTASEVVKNANLKTGELYFKDPGTAEGPPPNKEQMELQKQQQALVAQEQQLEQRRQQLDAQKAQQARKEMELQHQREMLELQRKSAADKDQYQIAQDKLRNELLEMRLKYVDSPRSNGSAA